MCSTKHRKTFSLQDALQLPLLVALGALFVVLLLFSLQWGPEHDTPLLHYIAFLIDHHHYTPYREIFETSFPGSLLFHLALVKIFGYSDLAFRLVDLALLGALSYCSFTVLRPFGLRAAWAAILLFGNLYLLTGPTISLQRDYLGIIPIAAALLIVTRNFPKRGLQALIIGAAFGASATIKPQLLLGFPALLLYLITAPVEDRPTDRASYARLTLLALLGLTLLPIAALAWLTALGALPDFLSLALNYLPLHIQIDGTHAVRSGSEKLRYLVESYLSLGGRGFLLVPALYAIYWIADRKLKNDTASAVNQELLRITILFASLILLYSIYPVLSGQFYPYHWMPLQYFLALGSALWFSNLGAPTTPKSSWHHLLILPFVLGALLPTSATVRAQLSGRPAPSALEGRVDSIVRELSALGYSAGDKVQPLDWARGANHALLKLRAPLATSFLYQYHFYHHIYDPYIQALRRRFIAELSQAQPRFLIEVSDWVKLWGPDTTESFPELEELIDRSYQPAYKGSGFVIYKRTLAPKEN